MLINKKDTPGLIVEAQECDQGWESFVAVRNRAERTFYPETDWQPYKDVGVKKEDIKKEEPKKTSEPVVETVVEDQSVPDAVVEDEPTKKTRGGKSK